MAIPIKNKRYTYKDYINWSDEEKYEIIEGTPYYKAPAPMRIHQEVSGELFFQIRSYLQGKECKVYAAPFDVRLCKDKTQDDSDIINVVQPDITVICESEKLDEKGAKGVPDFVIEIVSQSSTFIDYVKKLNLYGDFGVREYWIVNPMKKNVLVYKIMEDDKYGMPEIYNGEDSIKVSIFKDLIINLDSIW